MKSLLEKSEILLDNVDLTDASDVIGIATALKQMNSVIKHDPSVVQFSEKFANDAHGSIPFDILSDIYKGDNGKVDPKEKIIETVISLITSIILLIIQSKKNKKTSNELKSDEGTFGIIGRAKRAVASKIEDVAISNTLKTPYHMLDAVSNNDSDAFNIASIKAQNLFTQSLSKLTKTK